MILGDLIRFLFPYQRDYLNHGGRIISPSSTRGATDEESILIRAGVARSPHDARFLMAKYGTERAKDVLKIVNRLRPRITFKTRLKTLIQRIDGHDTRDVYGSPRHDDPTIRIQYRYRAKK